MQNRLLLLQRDETVWIDLIHDEDGVHDNVASHIVTATDDLLNLLDDETLTKCKLHSRSVVPRFVFMTSAKLEVWTHNTNTNFISRDIEGR